MQPLKHYPRALALTLWPSLALNYLRTAENARRDRDRTSEAAENDEGNTHFYPYRPHFFWRKWTERARAFLKSAHANGRWATASG